MLVRILLLVSYLFILFFVFTPAYESYDFDFISCQEINCSHMLIEFLQAHPNHVCAFYDLKDDALYDAINEGALFDENYEKKYSRLKPVSSKGLMHHKFCIFNQELVFTGSWNPTERGTNHNDNYVLLINSSLIAGNFFNMYEYLLDRSKRFEPLEIKSKTGEVSIFTCPIHNCQEEVLNTLSLAKQSVTILAFTFTDDAIAEKLISLSRKGVEVQVIFEKTRITRYSAIHDVGQSLVDVYHDGNPYTMHEKMMLIDDDILILGSYNPTKSATTKNDENLLIIRDRELFAKALREYLRVLKTANRIDIYK